LKNVNWKVDESKLRIEIDLTKEFGLSRTGKSIIIASTEGNIEVGNGIKLGLNCYRPRKEA